MFTAQYVSGGIATHYQELCIYSIWHYLDRYCYLSWDTWIGFLIQSRSDSVDTVIWAPDDGGRYHLNHVEQFSDINNLYIVASFWTIIGYMLRNS